MNILIIPPGALPIPAYKGGAVEALIQSYINYNEVQKEVNFTLYTTKDEKENWNNKYRSTEFKFIDNRSIYYKISKIIRYIINNKIPYFYIGNAFCTAVTRKLKKEKKCYDAIIVENNPFAILQLRKIYKNIPIILHLHNDYLNNETKKCKKILNEYDRVIAISNYIKSRIETIYQTEKISVVYNGININIFNQNVDEKLLTEYRKKYNITDKDVVLLYVGRLIKEKGIKELVDVTGKLIDNGYNNVKLLVVGTKASSDSKNDLFIDALKKKSNQYKSNIIFTGFIEYKNLPILHQISDIQIIPSKWGEPLGNVVIEGMASGIKQIVTNDGGIPEIIDRDNTVVIEKDNLTQNLYDALAKTIKKHDFEKKKNNEKTSLYSEESYSKNIIKLVEREVNEYIKKNKK